MKRNPITDRFGLMNPVMWSNQIEEDSLQTHPPDTHQTGCFVMLLLTNQEEVSTTDEPPSALWKPIFRLWIFGFYLGLFNTKATQYQENMKLLV